MSSLLYKEALLEVEDLKRMAEENAKGTFHASDKGASSHSQGNYKETWLNIG